VILGRVYFKRVGSGRGEAEPDLIAFVSSEAEIHKDNYIGLVRKYVTFAKNY
jgi:hypothetical protein